MKEYFGFNSDSWLRHNYSVAIMLLTEILPTALLQENLRLVLASLAVGLAIVWYIFRNRNLPPGPYGFPWLGYLPFLGNDTHLALAKLAKTYGDIMSFTVMGKTCVHLNNLDLVKEAFLARAEDFSGRDPEFSLLNFIDDGKGITQTEGPEWKEQRQFFLQTVRKFGYGKQSLEGKIQEEVTKFLEFVRESKGKPTDISVSLSNSTSNVISQVLLQTQFAHGEKDFQEIAHSTRDLVQQFIGARVFYIGPVARLLFPFLPDGDKLLKAKNTLHTAVWNLIQEHIQTYDPTDIRDFTDSYLEELQKIKEKKDVTSFSMDTLQANNVNLLMEGTESVSYTIYRMIRELAKHPETQARIQKELDDVVGSERLPSWTDRTSMPFTEATLYELQRFAIPFPLSAFHSNAKETTFRGYRIPKRSIIISNLWSIHQDPKLWPNPQKFDPGRFLNSDGKCVKREGLSTFGLGKRACPGEPLAIMEIFLFMTSLLQKFTISDPGTNNPADIQYEVVAVPRNNK